MYEISAGIPTVGADPTPLHPCTGTLVAVRRCWPSRALHLLRKDQYYATTASVSVGIPGGRVFVLRPTSVTDGFYLPRYPRQNNTNDYLNSLFCLSTATCKDLNCPIGRPTVLVVLSLTHRLA